MSLTTDPFEFTYRGIDILFGRGRAGEIGDVLAQRDLDRALIVCGSNVGANEELMGPIEAGLGDRLAGTFDETTPAKRIETAYDGIERMREVDADVLVGVGGGSSLDIARQMSALAADGRSQAEIKSAANEGTFSGTDFSEPVVPVVVVPTTFAGADVSTGGSLVVLAADESPTGQPITVSGSVPPIANVADPAAVETTPLSALEGSAMNGFDKGIETLYARESNPFSDATAIHGLRYLFDAFSNLSTDHPDAIDRAVLGMLLVQYERKASIIHAFGHAFARRYPVQQGHVHAVMAPHVLRYVLETVDGFESKFAAAIGADLDDVSSPIDEIVAHVAAVRDSLDVPQQASELPGADPDDIPALAEFVLDDWMMPQAPTELDPTQAEIEAILEEAW
jgi:alcohol dehydrogenase class IV